MNHDQAAQQGLGRLSLGGADLEVLTDALDQPDSLGRAHVTLDPQRGQLAQLISQLEDRETWRDLDHRLLEGIVTVTGRLAAAGSRRRRVDTEESCWIDAPLHRVEQGRVGLDRPQPRLDRLELTGSDPIELVQHQQVGSRHLVLEDSVELAIGAQLLGVDHDARCAIRYPVRDRISPEVELRIEGERHSRGFDDDPVRVGALAQLHQCADQLIGELTAYTAALDLDVAGTLLSEQSSVDAERSELVGDHGDAQPNGLRVCEKMRHQGGLSRAQEARDDERRDLRHARSLAEGYAGPRMPQAGVLLINLGTPASPRVSDVRRYLRQFLLDPRVIDIPAPLRWLLVEFTILPFRPRRSAALYRSIWMDAGSPLLVHSRALERALARELGSEFRVALGMRYGEPTVRGALASLEGCSRIVVAPLYPQYASASTESALDAVRTAGAVDSPVLPPFFEDPGFLESWVEVARPVLESADPEHVLFSFHGLPERQIRKLAGYGEDCLERETCCEQLGPGNRSCYRAQCFATARALALDLELEEGSWGVSFQSRLGRNAWIRPSTVERLDALRAAGVRRLAVLCPSFVADCLETTEEIGIRARAQWERLGGEALALVPCLNAHPRWVRALAERVREALP